MSKMTLKTEGDTQLIVTSASLRPQKPCTAPIAIQI